MPRHVPFVTGQPKVTWQKPLKSEGLAGSVVNSMTRIRPCRWCECRFRGRNVYLLFLRGVLVPIYAYRCTDCGHAEDVLQKMSDSPLTDCPACGKSTYAKQVTAAGFQLKGSGWYVTDFRNNGSKPASTAAPSEGASSGSGSSASDTSTSTPAA